MKKIMRPKKLDDQYLDGQKYAEYIRQIVHAINKEQTFCLQDVMLNIIRAEANELLANLKSKYARDMSMFVGDSSYSKPKTVKEFGDREKEVYDESIAAIKDKLSYREQIFKEYIAKFDQYRARTMEEYMNRLNGQITAWDKKTLNDLWVSRMKTKCSQAFPEYSSIEEFERDLYQLKTEFEKVLIQKEKHEELWQSFIQEINVTSIKNAVQNEIVRKRIIKEAKVKEPSFPGIASAPSSSRGRLKI
jgi:hypothetical protein